MTSMSKSKFIDDAFKISLLLLMLLYAFYLYKQNETPRVVKESSAASIEMEKSIKEVLEMTKTSSRNLSALISEYNNLIVAGGNTKQSDPSDDGSTASDMAPEKYIYVYDFGEETKKITTDLTQKSIRYWSSQYEGEYELFDLLYNQKYAVTGDPEKAVLFYVPFYSSRYTLSYFTRDDLLQEGVEETSKVWEELLTKIKRDFPYFNRSNGRDHFSALTMDHGRCTGLMFVNPSVYGEMFFIQLNADKMVRGNHAYTSRGIQALTYNYGLKPILDLPDIPCYMSDRDIVIPPKIEGVTRVKPNENERKIVALFRFGAKQQNGLPIPHFNHLIRKELLDMYKDKGIKGWDFGEKWEWETTDDWKQSIFCIAPPGHSQWTSRPTKAIIAGCIPVNFYRDHDNPWQDEINWKHFSINIDPDNLDSLPDRINDVLNTPGKLAKMQQALESVQEYFLWGDEYKNGARAHMMRALRRRANQLMKLNM